MCCTIVISTGFTDTSLVVVLVIVSFFEGEVVVTAAVVVEVDVVALLGMLVSPACS